jgi:hypothetical protein
MSELTDNLAVVGRYGAGQLRKKRLARKLAGW